MKKIVNILASLALAFFGLGLISCADAIVDDGSNVRSYVNSASGGTSSGGGTSASGANWRLCKNSGYDIFDIQVWAEGESFEYENKADCGRFVINSNAWIGGGLVPSSSGKTFDFSGVSKMTFEIRGSISPQALSFSVQCPATSPQEFYPEKNCLKTTAKIGTLSEVEWTSVTFDVSGAASSTVIDAFCIIAAPDWGSSIATGQWVEVRNLDWTDESGKSVTISLK